MKKVTFEKESVYKRDNFRCIYCGKYLFDNLDDWQNCDIDHLITKQTSHKDLNYDDPNFWVMSCKVCNTYRNSWSPVIELNEDNKEKYINEIRNHIFGRRSEKMIEFFDSLKRLGLWKQI